MKSCLTDDISRLKDALDDTDAVLIGAGSGLSTSAGLAYSGERFEKYFKDFADTYGIRDMYTGGFYPFPSAEIYWAWWSRHIWYNRYETVTNDVYKVLHDIVRNKDHFVITTNVDHMFQNSGFDEDRLFCPQGDYGLFQCSVPCDKYTYPNKDAIEQMILQQHSMRIPTDLIPVCDRCGKPLVPNLRVDETFVQDELWYASRSRYDSFIAEHTTSSIVYLELGVGMNTPVWIKYPFWQMTFNNRNATYACVDLKGPPCPDVIRDRSILVTGDIYEVLNTIHGTKTLDF